ncbi:hypothetical protein [Nostoc phage N1]|nr:hypothetical protein [Nostoc phage N1]
MQTVFLGTCWDSVKNIEILSRAGYNIEKEYKGIVKPELLLPEEQGIFNGLLDLLGLEFGKDITNVGLTIFDEDWQYIYFTYPCVGLGEKDQLGLMIGAENGTEKAAFLPMQFTPAKEKDEAGEYHIITPKGKKIRVGLTSIPGSDGKTRHYLMIKNKSFIFNLPFKAVNDELSTAFVNESFDYGTFDECCKAFFKSGVKFSNMFKPRFIDGTFPAQGVILILKNGRISESEQYGRSTIWTIAGSSHPDLMVIDSNKNNPTEILLSDADTIFVSSACTASKHLFSGANNNDVYIIHAVGKNSRGNLDHLPEHKGYALSAVPPRFKTQYPGILEQAKKISLGALSSTMKQMTAIAQSNEPDPDLDSF